MRHIRTISVPSYVTPRAYFSSCIISEARGLPSSHPRASRRRIFASQCLQTYPRLLFLPPGRFSQYSCTSSFHRDIGKALRDSIRRVSDMPRLVSRKPTNLSPLRSSLLFHSRSSSLVYRKGVPSSKRRKSRGWKRNLKKCTNAGKKMYETINFNCLRLVME